MSKQIIGESLIEFSDHKDHPDYIVSFDMSKRTMENQMQTVRDIVELCASALKHNKVIKIEGKGYALGVWDSVILLAIQTANNYGYYNIEVTGEGSYKPLIGREQECYQKLDRQYLLLFNERFREEIRGNHIAECEYLKRIDPNMFETLAYRYQDRRGGGHLACEYNSTLCLVFLESTDNTLLSTNYWNNVYSKERDPFRVYIVPAIDLREWAEKEEQQDLALNYSYIEGNGVIHTFVPKNSTIFKDSMNRNVYYYSPGKISGISSQSALICDGCRLQNYMSRNVISYGAKASYRRMFYYNEMYLLNKCKNLWNTPYSNIATIMNKEVVRVFEDENHWTNIKLENATYKDYFFFPMLYCLDIKNDLKNTINEYCQNKELSTTLWDGSRFIIPKLDIEKPKNIFNFNVA